MGPVVRILLWGLVAAVQAVTYPGGVFEPCIDPAPDVCHPTRCIHLYTVPGQYSCRVTTYPLYDYDPQGRQCARPECVCANGYHGGSCKPHVQHHCLQHHCTRNQATSYAPTRVHPGVEVELAVHGIGLNSWPWYDEAKVVIGDCTNSNQSSWQPVLAPGTNYSTDLGPGEEERAAVVSLRTTFAGPGSFTLCYKEQAWDWHPVGPALTVAGATHFSTIDGNFGRRGTWTRIQFQGFGFTTDDRMKVVSPSDVAEFEARYLVRLNNTCDADAAYNASTALVDELSSYTDVLFGAEENFTVCHQASGGEWRDLGLLEVGDVPQWYELVYSNAEAGGRILRSPMNVSFGGSSLGFAVGSGGDIVEVRNADRVYYEANASVRWTWVPCGEPNPSYQSDRLAGDGQSWVNSQLALWDVYLTAPLNSTSVCYYSWRYQRWLAIPPRNPWDTLEVRELWLHGFDHPQPSCLAGWSTLYGRAPICADEYPTIPNIYFQNHSMYLPAGSGVAYTMPITVISPTKFQFYVLPTCATSPGPRITILDAAGFKMFSLHFGCPYLTVDHEPSDLDWASSGNDQAYDATAWHKVTVHMQFASKRYYLYYDGRLVGFPGQSSLRSFTDSDFSFIRTIRIENDNLECPVLFDHMRMYDCFQTQKVEQLKDRVQTFDLLADIPMHLLAMAAGGEADNLQVTGNAEEEALTFETCLAED
uniref:EGF-like domain-containing protein n=1 Tax=Eutreptiella gymnastica TaxID=73025 RepID=A0A7S1HWR8_9EUGL|mmetsp:Transcript_111313/g.193178  ORF Transcript_111313/g.193178 Transcript_111313/m.193178 type:complete len:702 (+) Transcript_111313:58-2163(+)